MKLCKDCKHCVDPGRFAECHTPKAASVNYVTGEENFRWIFASTQRHGNWLEAYITGTCGPQARWFESKDAE